MSWCEELRDRSVRKVQGGGDWQLTCMNAVAMMTPDPKYLQAKNTHSNAVPLVCFFAKTGNQAPGEV
jgi:hypothetical protein